MTILNLSNLNLTDTFEPTVIPAGEERKLRVINIIQGTSKKGDEFIMPFFECPDEPYMKEFGKYLPMPNASMEPKQLNRCKLDLANFFNAFEVDITGDIDLESVKGAEGWAILGVGKDQDGAPVNTINKFVINR